MATATYPPPPTYYKLYKKHLEDPTSVPEPPPPIQGTYLLCGATYTTDDALPSLEEQGVRQLYPKGPNARATLIHIMELQIQQRKQAVEDIKMRREEAQRLLKEAVGTLDGQ